MLTNFNFNVKIFNLRSTVNYFRNKLKEISFNNFLLYFHFIDQYNTK